MIKLSTNNELEKAAKILAKNFMMDPLYDYIFDGKPNKQQAMEAFFLAYVAYIWPYSDVLADSEEMDLIVVVWFSNRVKSSLVYTSQSFKFAYQLLKLSRMIGLSGALKLIKTIKLMSSTWIDKHVEQPYCHLDLAVIDPTCRGKGLFSACLNYLETTYRPDGQIFTLETQSLVNVEKYKHLGFSIVEEIELPNSHLVQYCMIKEINSQL